MANVTVLGLFCVDLIARTERLPAWGESLRGQGFSLKPGGKGANQAVAAAYQGAAVSFISRLGDDAFAAIGNDLFAAADVDTTFITTDPNLSTGTATILVSTESGNNAIVVDTGACRTITTDHIDTAAECIKKADIFVCQLELPLAICEYAIAIAHAHDVPVILNPAPALEIPQSLYASIDYLTPNESEAEVLVGHPVESDEQVAAAAATLRQRGVGNVLITLGERGVYIDSDTFKGIIPALKAGPVVDTIGAGDAFNGALAAALADGQALPDAAHRACVTAGLSVTKEGAATSLPSKEMVDQQLNGLH